MGRLTARALDAVTVDGYGTLLTLVDPVDKLRKLLPEHSRETIRSGVLAEVDYYAAHSHTGCDQPSLARLHAECTAVFNARLGSALTPEQYVGALEFEVLPGVEQALARLRGHGLALAVVANWDFSLHEHLRAHGLRPWFDEVVLAGELGTRKPDPAPFLAALERLAVGAERAVHVGDHRPHDELGARAAGMRFEPAPLLDAVDRLL